VKSPKAAVLFAVVLLGMGLLAERERHTRASTAVRALPNAAGDELDARLGGRKMDLRRADALALRSVPGLGPSLSRRLIEAREAGRLESWADVRAVPGMGPRRLETLQRYADIAPARSDRLSPTSR
jgi:hypothetical protein